MTEKGIMTNWLSLFSVISKKSRPMTEKWLKKTALQRPVTGLS